MPQRFVVSRFTTVSWLDGEVRIASPVSVTTFTNREPAILGVLAAFAVPRAIDEVADSEDVAATIAEWIEAAILVDADSAEAAAEQHWDPESLALHASSRLRPWRKMRVPMSVPAVAPRRSEETIPLAPAAGVGELGALLGRRRTRYVWANAPIAFQAFSALFWMGARNRPTDRTEHVSRPYPSAGAAYSLELYAVLAEAAVETLGAGVYRYLPEAHALEVVAPFGDEAQRILTVAGKTAATAPPPVAIVITSRYARQSERYGRLAYTLVLKEVGCLFQTFYLCAESLGLAACALGRNTPAELFARLSNTNALEEPVVGEFAIGAAAD